MTLSNSQSAADAQIVSYIERIERLQEEGDGIKADIKSVFDEAKGNGFDVKSLREMLKLRKMDEEKRRSWLANNQLYARACGIDLDPEGLMAGGPGFND